MKALFYFLRVVTFSNLYISMSKNKGKEKKQENYEVLQKQFQQQKRQLLDTTFTLRKMQQRVNLLTMQNHRLEQEKQTMFHTLNEKIEELTIKNQTNEKRLFTMRNDLTTAEVQNKKLNNTVNLMEKNMNDERADRTKDFQELKKNYNFQVAKYENMLTDYKLYMGEREGRQRQIVDLVEQRQLQIANRIREVADKQREKVQAVDKIRDQMSNKIREMRQNLLSLKKQQLETTTRLTMLQNHQLTSELQYQSKQTEKIVFKNQELQAMILQLKQQLQIHKQVEDQLAKRSHFSKGIIKKLHSRVAELQEELKKQKEHSQIFSEGQSINKAQKPENNMASAMDKELERSQKKYAQLLTRFQCLRKQKQDLNTKLQHEIFTKTNIFKTLENIFSMKNYEKQNMIEKRIGLGELKGKDISDWTQQQKNNVFQLILTACKPMITRQELIHPIYSKIIIFDGDKHNYLPKLSTQREKLIHSTSQNKLYGIQDVCRQAKQDLSKEKYSTNIASKMVIGKVRQWGKPVTKSRCNLQRKYKLSATMRN